MTADELIVANLGFAKRIGQTMGRMCAPEMRRDVVGAALLGLVEAAGRFDAGRGVAFQTFAYTRVVGAVMDQFRSLGWVRDPEVRAALGEPAVRSLGPGEEFVSVSADPAFLVEVRQRLDRAGLDRREEILLHRIYELGLDYQEAGRFLGWSKSWASRKHRGAVAKLLAVDVDVAA